MNDRTAASQREIAKLYTPDALYSSVKVAQAHVKLDNDEMKEIIDQYISDTPTMFKSLNAAWLKSDYGNIILYAHSIVGVSRILKLDVLSNYAKTIEMCAKEGKRSQESVLKLLNEHNSASIKTLKELF